MGTTGKHCDSKMRWAKCLLLVASVATALPTDDRETKAFSLFSVVSFPNEPCNTLTANVKGICVTKEECGDRSGKASGNCASGFGVCCFTSVDGTTATITNTMTWIQNPGFPSPVTSGASRTSKTFTYPIQALASTAAIRLDFQTGVFEQPTSSTGKCDGDTVAIAQASGTITLCGVLTGQHVYLENSGTANMANSLTITISSNTFSRTWRILVTILEVGDSSIEGKPSGCLQWFTGETGRITSFNHVNSANTQGRNIGGLSYAICIKPLSGCVDFRESGGTTGSFSLDATAVATSAAAVGTCTNTALIIPNIDVQRPNYCGTTLANTNSQTTASIVRSTGHSITFFSTSTGQAATSSFDLMYQQVDC